MKSLLDKPGAWKLERELLLAEARRRRALLLLAAALVAVLVGDPGWIREYVALPVA